MKYLFYLICLILLITLVSAVVFIPNGNIEGLGIRSIRNFTNISADKFCDNSEFCGNVSQFLRGDIVNTTTQFSGDISGTYNSISVNSSSKFNVTLLCFDSASVCSVNESWNGSCLIRNTPTTQDKQGSAC